MVDINALISSWFSVLFSYIESLKDYVIVEGVSFFTLLLAIGIFSIIVHIFFVKIISFGNAPAVSPHVPRHSPGFVRGRRK